MFRLDEIIEAATAQLLEAIKAKEPKIVERLIEFIARMDTLSGAFITTALNDSAIGLMDRYIQAVLLDLNVNKDISDFVKTFDDASAYALGIQKAVNGIVAPTEILTKWREFAIRSTVESLIGNGMVANFAEPIRKILATTVYGGGSLTDVLKSVRAFAETQPEKKGGLLSYYTQVSRDAVGQYAGNVHRIVAKQYGLDSLEYVGSLIKDSRPQCIRWVNMETIKLSELSKEIRWAENNGSGLIPGTNADNFIVNRGGYNCRHEAIPVRSKK